jgi:hypothetical protein
MQSLMPRSDHGGTDLGCGHGRGMEAAVACGASSSGRCGGGAVAGGWRWPWYFEKQSILQRTSPICPTSFDLVLRKAEYITASLRPMEGKPHKKVGFRNQSFLFAGLLWTFLQDYSGRRELCLFKCPGPLLGHKLRFSKPTEKISTAANAFTFSVANNSSLVFPIQVQHR